MNLLKIGLYALFLALLSPAIVTGQPESPFLKSLKVDIGYAFPTYFGDFSNLGGGDIEFVELSGRSPIELIDEMQFNQSSINGSITGAITDRLEGRLKFSQATFFFSEDTQARVNFKNTVFDIAFLAQYTLFESVIDGYIYGGPGINFHKDAEIFDTSIAAQTAVNTNRKQSVSTTLGLGFEYDFGDRFSLFVEAEYLNTGSDRIDGYNGFTFEDGFTKVSEDEKSYFNKDYFLKVGGGIRFKLFGKHKEEENIPEETRKAPLPTDTLATKEVESAGDSLIFNEPDINLSEEEKTINILTPTDLSGGYLVKVNFVLTLEELQQQIRTAMNINNILFEDKDVNIFPVKEPNGYVIYFGYFNTLQEAKNRVQQLRQFYSETSIIQF